MSSILSEIRLVWVLILVVGMADGAMPAPGPDESSLVQRVDGSFVREFLVLGPFPAKEMNIDYLAEAGGEANVRPKEGVEVRLADGTRLRWRRLRSKVDWVSAEPAVSVSGSSVSYAYCELESEQACETEIRLGYYGPSAIWLNGRIVNGSMRVRHWEAEGVPVMPVRLNAGRNGCLLKFKFDLEPWQFFLQQLPPGRASVEVRVTDSGQRNVSGALVQIYDQGEVVEQLRTDDLGRAQVRFLAGAASYELKVTAGEQGSWHSLAAFQPGESRKLEVTLKEAISISGRVAAMDGFPQSAIVVQAIRLPDSSNFGSDGLPGRVEIPAGTLVNVAADSGQKGGIEVPGLPEGLPVFSDTVLTDTNGIFRFVNLRSGRYQLRAHGRDGFVAPDATGPVGEEGVRVEPGRHQEGVRFAFPEAKKGDWKILPVTQGLRPVPVRKIQRGPSDMLWVGTSESFLYAYDGLAMKLMASAPVIAGNLISDLAYSADGTLWVGTGGGASRLRDGRLEAAEFNELLPRKAISSIITDADGAVWLGGNFGLFHYDGRTLTDMGARKELPSIHVSSVLRARDGSTWVATYAGLVRFNGSSISRVDPFRGSSPRRAERLYQARDGAIWFCNHLDAPGAYRYDGSTWTRFGRKDGLLSDRVFCMGETSDGTFWFGTSDGLSRMKGMTVVNFTKHDGIAESAVHDIYVDADDVLWCATDQGVLRFDTKGFVGFTKRDGLSSAGGATVSVLAIEPDPAGGFWIGTEWGGGVPT